MPWTEISAADIFSFRSSKYIYYGMENITFDVFPEVPRRYRSRYCHNFMRTVLISFSSNTGIVLTGSDMCKNASIVLSYSTGLQDL